MSGISKEARDLIINEEVGGEATYKRLYMRPEWPGGSSGITIGIGYDVGAGVANKQQLREEWGGRIPNEMIAALEPAIGVTGTRAKALLPSIRKKVEVPWDMAIAVFDEVDIPKWISTVRRALPHTDLLSPDCLGVLVSLTYNRGASFGSSGPRYSEMRAIKRDMEAKNFADIPAQLRSMKRLWPSLPGLVKRREHEARLFEHGMQEMEISKGEHNALWLQQALNRLGAQPQLNEDGILGPATKTMLMRFQAESGLLETGKLDFATEITIQQHLDKLE